MADYTITVGGTDVCAAYGASLLDFAETLPQPKVVKVSIPAGIDIDITDAFGAMGYANGKHSVTLLVRGGDEAERMRRVRELVALLHGKMLDYALSWDAGYTYRGRMQLSVERAAPYASRVVLDIDRRPWKTKRETVVLDAHPSATHVLEGSVRWHELKATLAQDATARIDGGAATSHAAGTRLLAADLHGSEHTVLVTVADWLMYVDEDANLVVNPHYGGVTDGDVQVGSSYTVTDGDMAFALALAQRVTLRYYRWDL